MSDKKKRVMLIGWNPEVVDYSKWPDMDSGKVRAALEANREKLITLGYDTDLFFIDDAESAFGAVVKALQENVYDGVMIGAGVRLNPAHLMVFEQLVNAVHEASPQAKICFNTNPQDTAEALMRC